MLWRTQCNFRSQANLGHTRPLWALQTGQGPWTVSNTSPPIVSQCCSLSLKAVVPYFRGDKRLITGVECCDEHHAIFAAKPFMTISGLSKPTKSSRTIDREHNYPPIVSQCCSLSLKAVFPYFRGRMLWRTPCNFRSRAFLGNFSVCRYWKNGERAMSLDLHKNFDS